MSEGMDFSEYCDENGKLRTRPLEYTTNDLRLLFEQALIMLDDCDAKLTGEERGRRSLFVGLSAFKGLGKWLMMGRVAEEPEQ